VSWRSPSIGTVTIGSDDDLEARLSAAAAKDAALAPIDWAALPPEVERDVFAAPSGPLARIALGPADGDRVVLMPGMTGSKEDFVRVMPRLAASGYRVESFDMAGQYESSEAGPPPGGHYTMALFEEDLRAVLASGPAPAHVLGYSFAGTVAAVVAGRHPELVRSLTLLSTTPRAGQALRAFKVLGPVSGMLPPPALGRLFVWVLRHNVHRAPRDRATFVTARFARTSVESVIDIFGLMKQTPDVAPGVRAAGIPTLVVVGAHDVWPLEAHRAFAAQLGGRLVVLDAGHSPCETAPNQLAEAMMAFFDAR